MAEWREGFHAPKGVSADDVKATLDRLEEPSPENLLHATKAKRHPLHDAVWGEGDQVWAQRGRLEYCRRIIGAINETIVVGGKSIEIRVVEFIRTNGSGQWTSIDDIRNDPLLLDAYLAEVQRLQEQAVAKLEKVRVLMRG